MMALMKLPMLSVTQQELDDGVDEVADVERDGLARCSGCDESDLHGLEVDASGDKSDDRADEVVDKAVDDCSERAADDDTDCHVEDVAAGDELLEFSEKTCVFHFSFPLFLMY